ncbi:actin-related protein, putative [Hepatocystis sp. ex Piliocolobus tephrosceles]|nr:actin-related protein, putative [Hepatocystis sp. ex Piliocolobus tephrosceles]
MSLQKDSNEFVLCGGEDISALVVDLGFNSSKIGHNQEDTPRIFLNSICGEEIINNENINENLKNKLKFPLNICNRSENVKIKPLFYKNNISHEVILNSDVFEKIIEYSIEGTVSKRVFECNDEIIEPIKTGGLNLKLNEHPILLSEANIHNNKIREEITEILFEKYNIPAIYFAKKAKLTSFSLGRSNSLVVDIGHSSLNINPIYEGYVLQKNSFEYDVGGDYLDRVIYEKLKADNINIVPYFCYNNISLGKSIGNNSEDLFKNIHSSYKEEGILDVIRYMKETICKVRVSTNMDCNENIKYEKDNVKDIVKDNMSEEHVTDYASSSYPSGNNPSIAENSYSSHNNGYTNNGYTNNGYINNNHESELKDETFDLPDGTKINIDKYKYDIAEHLFKSIPHKNNFKGLPQAIINCILSTDVDIRKDLLQSIIVTGGSALFSGLVERLYNSLKEKECFTQFVKLKILNTTMLVELKYSSWIGGSILASLGTFQQLWVSKEEYSDAGHGLIFDRCF